MKNQIIVAAVLVFATVSWAAPSSKTEQAKLLKEAKITMQQAEHTALQKEPGKIQSKELEKENGILIYSFDVQTKSGIHEVNVNAVTGAVVEDSVESASAEAKEKQQDKASSQTMKPPRSH